MRVNCGMGIHKRKAIFRPAVSADTRSIRKVAGKFFDDTIGGFSSLEERIAAGIIFVLEDKKDLLGGGIIEKGVICRDCASIGMFVNHDFRGKGYAPLILLKRKEWCYLNDLKPIALAAGITTRCRARAWKRPGWLPHRSDLKRF